jgi:methionyl aminopeptidase
VLKKGDIVNLDITVIKDGYHGDTSRMFIVGEASHPGQTPVRNHLRVHVARHRPGAPGAHLGDIGARHPEACRSNGFSVVREFCGHGIGAKFHEEPQVLHYGKPGTGIELKPGMIFTIEPMINAGKAAISELPDGWTIVTKDRSLSAQWEHTVLVTDTGVEVLTLSAGSPAARISSPTAALSMRPRRSVRPRPPLPDAATRVSSPATRPPQERRRAARAYEAVR